MLKICNLSDIDFSNATNSSQAFVYCKALTTLVLNSTWKMNLDLRQSPLLSRESILGIFNDLPVISETKTIRLSSYAKYNAKLTSEEIAIVTQKGWTVA